MTIFLDDVNGVTVTHHVVGPAAATLIEYAGGDALLLVTQDGKMVEIKDQSRSDILWTLEQATGSHELCDSIMSHLYADYSYQHPHQHPHPANG